MNYTVRLGDVIETILDYRGKTPPKVQHGIRLLTTGAIKNGEIIESSKHFISHDTYEYFMQRGVPKKGDILFTMEAPAGEVAKLNNDELYALAQRVVAIRVDAQKVNADYLYYYFQSKEFRNLLNTRITGATVSGITKAQLLNIELNLPSMVDQNRAVSLISQMDELICLNKNKLQLLNTMARSIYKAAIYNPGKGVVVSLEYKCLSDIAEFNKKKQLAPGEFLELQYIDISAVHDGYISQLKSMSINEAPTRARKKVNHGDIIFSSIRPENKSWALILSPPPNLIVSTAYMVLSAKSCVDYSWLYLTITDQPFVNYIQQRTQGATIPTIKLSTLTNAPVPWPSRESRALIESQCQPLLAKIHVLHQQNYWLKSIVELLIMQHFSRK